MAKQTEAAEASNAGGEERSVAQKASTPRSSTRGRAAAPRRNKSGVALQKLLKGEHARLDALFRGYESAEEAQKDDALRALGQELIIQMTVKEQVLYPALQEARVEEAMINEALVSYDLAKFLLRDIFDGPADDHFRDAKVALLAQTVEHHVAKEEQPRQGLLAKAAGIDDAGVTARMQERRRVLEAESERGMPAPMPVVTFHRKPGSTRRPGEESTMPQHGPDRDEHGRFISNEESHRGRGGGGGRYGRMEDDDRGRGMQSRGGRSYQEDEDYRGRGGREGGGGRDQSQGGWFGDPQGHSQASRMGWDERRREGSDRGESGWFGDLEGHSDASRRGWDTRRREGTDHDSGWHGDPQGHSDASRRGWETRRREGTDHDSGWHGDPQGHSQASRMGWETRRREGTDHFSGDDRGRGRSGGGYEGGGGRGYENEGRGSHTSGGGYESRSAGYESRSGGRGYGGSGSGGGRDQNQGGWFGDPEGHSEASRRGWESRRHDDDDDRGGRGRR